MAQLRAMSGALTAAAPAPTSLRCPAPAIVRTGADALLEATERLLVAGGDARISLGEQDARNRYGCRPLPDPGMMAFGSATASVISERSFAAADRLRRRLVRDIEDTLPADLYARELDRIRTQLVRLCGVSDLPGLQVLFAASGTDVHLIAAQLVSVASATVPLVVTVDAAETGSGVPAAVAGRHFSAQTAFGDRVTADSPIAGARPAQVVNVPLRLGNGAPRSADDVDAQVSALVARACATGRRVLLVPVDGSKTGAVAPSGSCIRDLHRKFPEQVDVLIDACQFRVAPRTVHAYLEHGFMVALTGSKFIGGPSFSGALLVPAEVARRLCSSPLPAALRPYSAQAEWPVSWSVACEHLNTGVNFGLLLRWEAALQELREFRAVPEAQVMNFLRSFGRAVRLRLANDPIFEQLSVPLIDRRSLGLDSNWDSLPTIFPFLSFRLDSRGARVPLSRAEVTRVWQRLYAGSIPFDGAGRSATGVGARCQLGQPVACGQHNGLALSALRLCVSAPLIVEATSGGRRAVSAVIERAMAALDMTARLAREPAVS